MAAEVGKKYVIIGNGIAGTTCAQMLRKNDVSCSIWLITNEPHPLYNRVSLPRYLQGLLPEQKVALNVANPFGSTATSGISLPCPIVFN